MGLEQEILQKLFILRFTNKNWPMPVIKMYESGLASEIALLKVVPTEMTYANFETKPENLYRSFFQKVI
jgi:hypothetical protein